MRLKLRSVGWFRKRFIDWIDHHAVDEGRADTPYTGLSVFRISSTTVVRKEPTFGVTLGIVAQGRKSLRVDGRTLEIDPAHYLVVTREMQYDATVQPESELRPFLGVGITFPPELVAKALVALADGSDSRSTPPTSAFTAPLEATLAEPLSRLLNAVDDPVEGVRWRRWWSKDLCFGCCDRTPPQRCAAPSAPGMLAPSPRRCG